MSKTKEYKKVLCKYLAQLMFTKVISENDYKIINEFLSDDTIILSKKELSKFIKFRAFIDPSFPRKDTDKIVPFVLEIFLDLKSRPMYLCSLNENDDILLSKYVIECYLNVLENLGENEQDE